MSTKCSLQKFDMSTPPDISSMQFDKIALLWLDLLTLDQKSSMFLSKKSLAGGSARVVSLLLFAYLRALFELSSTGS